MRQRGLLLLFAAIVLSGCGSEVSKPAEEAGLEPAPLIQTVDEPAPDSSVTGFQLDMSIPPECEENPGACTEESGCFRASNREGEDETWSGKCTPEEIKRIEEAVRPVAESYEPASDSEPRVIARLPLTGLERADLTVWRTKADKLCFFAEVRPTLERIGPMGPCEPSGSPPCPEICLAMLDSVGLAFVGIVNPRADEISFVLDAGELRRFPLVGPLVAGFDQRIFMAHLGRKSLRRIELFREGERIAQYVRPAEDIRLEDCERRFDFEDAGFQTCVDGTGEPPTAE